jgi:thioredoxin reductase (NADPH)
LLEDRLYDLIIIGGGPAGLTAGLYAARSRVDAVLLERFTPGGQVLTTDWVENWPGMPDGVSGFELIERMRTQAEKFGLRIENKEVVSLNLSDAVKEVHLSDGIARCKALIIASGATPRKLGVEGEELLTGKGVSYCGTCDGPFYREAVVAAVGGGDTAVEESIFLTRFAKKVYLIHRRDQLRATKIAQERAFANPKIEFVWNTVVKRIRGDQKVEAIELLNVKSGHISLLDVEGVFVFVGIRPNTEFVGEELEKDQHGFIKVNLEMETLIPGVFAAGDVISKSLRQISTAAGDGATAFGSAERYLARLE